MAISQRVSDSAPRAPHRLCLQLGTLVAAPWNSGLTAIEHPVIDPFEATFVVPEIRRPGSLADFEDRYLQEMRTMPRLDIETAWELADMKEQVKRLTSRFEAQRTL